jgi:hypothetical protein
MIPEIAARLNQTANKAARQTSQLLTASSTKRISNDSFEPKVKLRSKAMEAIKNLTPSQVHEVLDRAVTMANRQHKSVRQESYLKSIIRQVKEKTSPRGQQQVSTVASGNKVAASGNKVAASGNKVAAEKPPTESSINLPPVRQVLKPAKAESWMQQAAAESRNMMRQTLLNDAQAVYSGDIATASTETLERELVKRGYNQKTLQAIKAAQGSRQYPKFLNNNLSNELKVRKKLVRDVSRSAESSSEALSETLKTRLAIHEAQIEAGLNGIKEEAEAKKWVANLQNFEVRVSRLSNHSALNRVHSDDFGVPVTPRGDLPDGSLAHPQHQRNQLDAIRTKNGFYGTDGSSAVKPSQKVQQEAAVAANQEVPKSPPAKQESNVPSSQPPASRTGSVPARQDENGDGSSAFPNKQTPTNRKSYSNMKTEDWGIPSFKPVAELTFEEIKKELILTHRINRTVINRIPEISTELLRDFLIEERNRPLPTGNINREGYKRLKAFLDKERANASDFGSVLKRLQNQKAVLPVQNRIKIRLMPL